VPYRNVVLRLGQPLAQREVRFCPLKGRSPRSHVTGAAVQDLRHRRIGGGGL